MKKYFKYLLVFIVAFLLNISFVNAAKWDYPEFIINPDDIKADTYVIGTHSFDRNTNSSYKGYLDVRVVMFASRTVESDSIDDMIIYYKTIDGVWIDAITSEEIDAPSNFYINYTDTKAKVLPSSNISINDNYGDMPGIGADKTLGVKIDDVDSGVIVKFYSDPDGKNLLKEETIPYDEVTDHSIESSINIPKGKTYYYTVQFYKNDGDDTLYSNVSDLLEIDNDIIHLSALEKGYNIDGTYTYQFLFDSIGDADKVVLVNRAKTYSKTYKRAELESGTEILVSLSAGADYTDYKLIAYKTVNYIDQVVSESKYVKIQYTPKYIDQSISKDTDGKYYVNLHYSSDDFLDSDNIKKVVATCTIYDDNASSYVTESHEFEDETLRFEVAADRRIECYIVVYNNEDKYSYPYQQRWTLNSSLSYVQVPDNYIMYDTDPRLVFTKGVADGIDIYVASPGFYVNNFKFNSEKGVYEPSSILNLNTPVIKGEFEYLKTIDNFDIFERPSNIHGYRIYKAKPFIYNSQNEKVYGEESYIDYEDDSYILDYKGPQLREDGVNYLFEAGYEYLHDAGYSSFVIQYHEFIPGPATPYTKIISNENMLSFALNKSIIDNPNMKYDILRFSGLNGTGTQEHSYSLDSKFESFNYSSDIAIKSSYLKSKENSKIYSILVDNPFIKNGTDYGYIVYRLNKDTNEYEEYKTINSSNYDEGTDLEYGLIQVEVQNGTSDSFKIKFADYGLDTGTVYSDFSNTIEISTDISKPDFKYATIYKTDDKNTKILFSNWCNNIMCGDNAMPTYDFNGIELFGSDTEDGEYTKIASRGDASESYTFTFDSSKVKKYYKVKTFTMFNKVKSYSDFSDVFELKAAEPLTECERYGYISPLSKYEYYFKIYDYLKNNADSEYELYIAPEENGTYEKVDATFKYNKDENVHVADVFTTNSGSGYYKVKITKQVNGVTYTQFSTPKKIYKYA